MKGPGGEHTVDNGWGRVNQIDQGQLCCECQVVLVEGHWVHFILGCLLGYILAIGDNLHSFTLGEGSVVKQLIK